MSISTLKTTIGLMMDDLYEELVENSSFKMEENQMSLMIRINLIVLMANRSSHSQSFFFVIFFRNHGGFIAAFYH